MRSAARPRAAAVRKQSPVHEFHPRMSSLRGCCGPMPRSVSAPALPDSFDHTRSPVTALPFQRHFENVGKLF